MKVSVQNTRTMEVKDKNTRKDPIRSSKVHTYNNSRKYCLENNSHGTLSLSRGNHSLR